MGIQRDDILTSACGLYLKTGMDGFSMRELARTLDVTAPALYRHYESREALLLDVIREAYKVFAQYLYRALEGACPVERLFLGGQGYVDFALEHPRYYEMLHASPKVLGIESLPEETEAQANALGQFWDDRIRECMDRGFMKKGDPQDVSLTMWAHCHGLTSLYLRGMLELDEEGFRILFLASSRRAISGMVTERYHDAFDRILQERGISLEPAAGVQIIQEES